MNPLQKARAGTKRAWWTARDGTARTAGWVKGGIASAPRRVVTKLRRGDGGAAPAAGAASGAASPRGPGLWERSGGRLVRAARARPRAAAAWTGGAAITAIWIGWTAYVWIENGAAAGIGVLISWPAVFAALAIVFSPFVGAGLLVRRHRVATGGPAIAGGASLGDASSAASDGETTAVGDDGGNEDDSAEDPRDRDESGDADDDADDEGDDGDEEDGGAS